MNFGTIKSTFWNPFGVYGMSSKRVGGQILGWRFINKQVPKRCSRLVADISLPFPGWNFQTDGDLELQDALVETRLLELSPRFGMTPFGQVFWMLCSLEVEAANLKSTGSFYFCFCTCYFWYPSPLFHLAGCLALLFMGFYWWLRPLNVGRTSACRTLLNEYIWVEFKLPCFSLYSCLSLA